MSSIESQILAMLEKSSIPGLYKVVFRNMLPNMSRIQQEDLFMILSTEASKKAILKTNMKKTYWQYNSILNELEDDPTAFDKELFGKKNVTKVPSPSNQELASLKSKIALQKMKKDL